MLTQFTVTVTAVIADEQYSFQRTLPLSNEMARRLAGEEIKMVLSDYYDILTASNMITGNVEKED
jgi:hypothetical protein